jgi:hypothetical protein
MSSGSNAFGARFEVVLAKIASSAGFMRHEVGDLPASYCFHYTHQGKTVPVFIPKPLIDGWGYTIRQLEQIERALVPFNLDLLPLDFWMH